MYVISISFCIISVKISLHVQVEKISYIPTSTHPGWGT